MKAAPIGLLDSIFVPIHFGHLCLVEVLHIGLVRLLQVTVVRPTSSSINQEDIRHELPRSDR
jgi:hypothetical protein